MLHRLLRRGPPGERGQALVETAMVLPVVILILLLGIDLGRVFFDSIELRNAAHEATMFGSTRPDATCGQIRPVIDREMGLAGANAAVCGSGTVPGRVYVTFADCEGTPSCSSWTPPYAPASDLRFLVRLEYRFAPAMPLVGLLTGNGVGGSVPIRIENRSPVLKGYAGE